MKTASRLLPHLPLLLLGTLLTARGASDYATPYLFSTLAGVSSIGSADGAGSQARFYSPQAVATDVTGNVFIADEGNHVIRKMTPAGVVTTLAGTAGSAGSVDGTGAAARFDSPQGLVTDATDNLYVTDTGNHTIRKITPAGVVTTFAGLAGVSGNLDGAAGTARLNRPRSLALDATGNLYVTEAGNRAIRKITPAGVVSTFASDLSFPETADIPASTPVAYGAIAVDAAGNVYVSRFSFQDSYTHASNPPDNYIYYSGNITKITPAGTSADLWTSTVRHYADGRLENHAVSGLAIDGGGNLYFAEGFQIMRYKPATGDFATVVGAGPIGAADGPAESARFGFGARLTFDRTGTIYVADAGNNNIRKVTATGAVTTVAGIALEAASGSIDATGSAARFAQPAGMAVDVAGNVYLADPAVHCIRRITPAGVATTLAGVPNAPGSADGTGTAARFAGPSGVAVDTAGNVYVADTLNHIIRKVLPSGETSTLAGTAGANGWDDGTRAAARFWYPYGITVDAAGNVYVTSAGTVRKIDPNGVTTTLAGHESDIGYVDGNGSLARFAIPYGITVDAGGNLYVTEAPDGPAIARVRKITPAGVVSTVAGADHGSTDGNGPAARFHNPYGVTVDTVGNLFVADAFNQTIRKITSQGTVTTIAGVVDIPGATDGTGREARFYYPRGIAVDSTGNIYASSGTTVRKGLLATLPVISTQPTSLSLTAGNGASFAVTAGGTPAPTYQWQRNGSAITGATSSTFSLAGAQSTDAGDYTVVVTNALGNVTSAKATLTVTAVPVPPPPVSTGGGGGAPSIWFLLALLSLGAVRQLRRWQTA